MTRDQVVLVKQSWKIFRNIDRRLIADTFYSKLFAEHPALRKMFPADMSEQYNKLIDTLNVIVSRLDRLDELNADIAALAKRHVKYGVRPAHYKLVGAALLWTLKQGLGTDWTLATEAAWSDCYNMLAETMIHAASDNISS